VSSSPDPIFFRAGKAGTKRESRKLGFLLYEAIHGPLVLLKAVYRQLQIVPLLFPWRILPSASCALSGPVHLISLAELRMKISSEVTCIAAASRGFSKPRKARVTPRPSTVRVP